jgi:hypothetical protein
MLKIQIHYEKDVGKHVRINLSFQQKRYDSYICSLDYNLLTDCIPDLNSKEIKIKI